MFAFHLGTKTGQEMANITYHIRLDTKGAKYIYAHISIKTFSRFKYKLPCIVKKEQWSTEQQLVKTRVKGAEFINDKLKALTQFIEEIQSLFPGKKITPELVKLELEKYLAPKEEEKIKSIFDWWDEWTEESKSRVSKITKRPLSPKTIGRYNVTKNHLLQFEKKTKYLLTPESINDIFYSKFRKYIITDVENQASTFSDQIKNLKTFCKWYQKREKTISNEFRDFERTSGSEGEIQPLRAEELLQIYNFNFTEITVNRLKHEFELQVGERYNDYIFKRYLDSLKKARLIFLNLCSCGFRISDHNNYDPGKHIMEMEHTTESGSKTTDKYIRLKSQKSNSNFNVPFSDDLLFRPVEILGSSIKEFGSMPHMEGQKLNKALKELTRIIKLDRIIVTSKTARKTFATIKLLQGYNEETVMRMAGWRSRSSFEAYIGIDTLDIIKEHKVKSQFLKVV